MKKGTVTRLWILTLIAGCFLYVSNINHITKIPSSLTYRPAEVIHPSQLFQHFPGYCQPLQYKHNIQCDRLIKGDQVYMKTVNSSKVHIGHTCNFTKLISNCTDFTSKHGYYGKQVSYEEENFPIAFGMKVHKDPLLAEQLLRTIYRPHNVYCIHVDLKSNKSVSDPILMLAKCFKNVFVIQNYRVVYSSIRQPLADIACMKQMFRTNVKWKYYLIVAGQEFPLKTNLEIVRILKLLNGTNDIESYPFPKHLQWRVNKTHPVVNDEIRKVSNISKLSFSYNISMFKGSAYGMLSRAFVRFVLEDQIAKEFLNWLSDTYAPEETIWATLNALPSAPGGYHVKVNHPNREFLSRAMLWRWDKVKCLGKYVHSVCVFSYKDLPWLVSSPEVVANKFHSDYDKLVVDCLEEWLHNKTMTGSTVSLNWSHYQHVPHVRMRG